MKGLHINKSILNKVLKLTTINFNFDLLDFELHFQQNEIDTTKMSLEALLNEEFKESELSKKKQILFYFYVKYISKNYKYKPGELINNGILASKLGLKEHVAAQQLKDLVFSYPIKCPCCGEETYANFINVKNPRLCEVIECKKCNHEIWYSISSTCKCDDCLEIISTIDNYYKNLEKNLEIEAQIVIQNKKNELLKENLKDEMLKWYADKNSSILTKDEREAISFLKLNNYNIEKLTEIFDYSKTIKVIQDLREKKVYYKKIKLNESKDIVEKFLKTIRFFVDFKNGCSYFSFSDIETSMLQVESIWFCKDSGFNVRFNDNSINLKDLYRLSEFDLSRISVTICYYEIKDINKSNFISEIELHNPHFFNNLELISSNQVVEQHVKCLFKSEPEINKYFFLKNKFDKYIVMVNVRLKDFIDVEKIKTGYDSFDIKYLYNCIVDFVIYNENGIPLKAIELQRGNHHNTEEYIRKDRLKREAIQKSGIIFEENF